MLVSKPTIRSETLLLLEARKIPATMTEVFRAVTLTDLLTVVADNLGRNRSMVRRQAGTMSMASIVKELATLREAPNGEE